MSCDRNALHEFNKMLSISVLKRKIIIKEPKYLINYKSFRQAKHNVLKKYIQKKIGTEYFLPCIDLFLPRYK